MTSSWLSWVCGLHPCGNRNLSLSTSPGLKASDTLMLSNSHRLIDCLTIAIVVVVVVVVGFSRRDVATTGLEVQLTKNVEPQSFYRCDVR